MALNYITDVMILLKQIIGYTLLFQNFSIIIVYL